MILLLKQVLKATYLKKVPKGAAVTKQKIGKTIENKNFTTLQKIERIEKIIEQSKPKNIAAKVLTNAGNIKSAGYTSRAAANLLNKSKDTTAKLQFDKDAFEKKVDETNIDLKSDFAETQEKLNSINDNFNFSNSVDFLGKQLRDFFWASNRDLLANVPQDEKYEKLLSFFNAKNKNEMFKKWAELYREEIEEIIQDAQEFDKGRIKGDEEVYEKYKVIYVQSTEQVQMKKNIKLENINAEKGRK